MSADPLSIGKANLQRLRPAADDQTSKAVVGACAVAEYLVVSALILVALISAIKVVLRF